MDKPQIIVHAQKPLNFTLYDCRWVPSSARFVVVGAHPRQTGALQVYEMAHSKEGKAETNLLHETEKQEAFRCCTFGASSLKQRHLATGDFKGNMRIWDLEKTDLPVYNVKGHDEIINSIDGVGGLNIGEGAPEIVTGSRDGSVKVWDPRQKDTPVACMTPAEGEAKRDCWSVAFGHAHNQVDRCIVSGYDNGDIKLFDLRNMSLRWETNVKNGVCCVEFDRKDINMNKLLVTTLESKFHVFDLRTQHPKKGFASMTEKSHNSTVWLGKHLPQNRDVFMTLGGAGSLHLWKYEYPENRVTKDSHDVDMGVAGSVSLLQNITLSTQPIGGFDWHPDKAGLCVCTSYDQALREHLTIYSNRLPLSNDVRAYSSDHCINYEQILTNAGRHMTEH